MLFVSRARHAVGALSKAGAATRTLARVRLAEERTRGSIEALAEGLSRPVRPSDA